MQHMTTEELLDEFKEVILDTANATRDGILESVQATKRFLAVQDRMEQRIREEIERRTKPPAGRLILPLG